MAYKMKGSPAKLGTIQGTSGHSSALKQKAKYISSGEIKQLERQQKKEKLTTSIAEGEEAKTKKAEKAAKEATKEKVRAYKKSSGKEKGGKYDVSTKEFEALSEPARAWITKKNRKVQAKMDKEVGEAKTESSFNVMDALGGFLSSGGGKEGLGAAFSAGFSKKSPNELLAMQKAREARSKGDSTDSKGDVNTKNMTYKDYLNNKEQQRKMDEAETGTTGGVKTVDETNLVTKKGGTK